MLITEVTVEVERRNGDVTSKAIVTTKLSGKDVEGNPLDAVSDAVYVLEQAAIKGLRMGGQKK